LQRTMPFQKLQDKLILQRPAHFNVTDFLQQNASPIDS
jgi:hypothetical protein